MAIEHHTALMEAALDRDIERAKALMIEHIGYTLHVYIHTEDQNPAQKTIASKGVRRAGAA
jgi:DNA-binding GntR family transcriptional regulator